MTTTRAFTFEATNDEYHARTEVSNSQISHFLDDPALFHAYHVTKRWPKPDPTDAMEFGTDIHDILPPGSLESRLVIIPDDVLNGQGHRKGAAWKEFEEENAGKILCKLDEAEPYLEIIKAAKDNPSAMALLMSPHMEFNIAWTDQETGIDCRVRLDRYDPSVVISDIKTTTETTPKGFSTAIWTLGYHRQAAFYQEGLYQLTGERLPFTFIACRKSRPYTVRCYDLDDDYMQAGREEWREALNDIARCRDSGVWKKKESDIIVKLGRPHWTRFEKDWK